MIAKASKSEGMQVRFIGCGDAFGSGGRVVAYTGDTEWTDALIPAGRNADLFISEAYFRDKRVRLHLDVASLERHLSEIGPRRVVLTHMSDEMLGRIDEVDFEVAEDGKIVRF